VGEVRGAARDIGLSLDMLRRVCRVEGLKFRVYGLRFRG